MRAIILAAGRGSRMGALTEAQPKGLVEVYRKPLIEHQIAALEGAGIKEIALVTGYRAACLANYGTHQFHNSDWAETNMVYSLLCARAWLDQDDCIVSYSDIYYTSAPVIQLMDSPDRVAITYDAHWLDLWSKRFEDPLDDAESFRLDDHGYVVEIGNKPAHVSEIEGQYMGLLKFSKGFWRDTDLDSVREISMTAFLQSQPKVRAYPNADKWFEIDSATDLEAIQQ